MSKPSGWLQAVCITAIVLGALGILSGLLVIGKLASGRALQNAIAKSQASTMPAGQREVQMEMQQKIEDVARRWIPLTLPLLAIELVVSICLILGAARTLRLRPAGRTLLLCAFWAAVIVELIQLGPTIAIQCEGVAITGEYMPRMMQASSPQGQQMPAEMQTVATTITKVMIVAGMVVTLLLALAQVGFYAFGAIYLGRPNVRARFAEPAAAELAGAG